MGHLIPFFSNGLLLQLERQMFQEPFNWNYWTENEGGRNKKSSPFISDLRAACAHQIPKTPVDSEVGPTKLIIAELNRTFFGHFRVSSKCSEIFLDFRNIRSSGTGQTFFGKFSEKLQVQSDQAKMPLDSIPLMAARFGHFTIIQTWIAYLNYVYTLEKWNRARRRWFLVIFFIYFSDWDAYHTISDFNTDLRLCG